MILEVTGPAYWLDVPHHDLFKKIRLTPSTRRKDRDSTQEEELIKMILKFSTPPRNVGVLYSQCHSQIANPPCLMSLYLPKWRSFWVQHEDILPISDLWRTYD